VSLLLGLTRELRLIQAIEADAASEASNQ
jgi:hypothetical protein